MEEVVRAHGHKHVRAEHASTWELTSDDWLTAAGDCILAVDADRTPADFDASFVNSCRDADTCIRATLAVDGESVTVSGRGDPALTFESDRSLVARTSTHVDHRTVLIDADAGAANLPRSMVEALADGADLTCTLAVGADG